jgi:hypothetical protein
MAVAAAARRPYIPGEYAKAYHSLDRATRKRVAGEVDRLFFAKTGVSRRLDEKAPRDHVLVRQWLLIRDAVVAIERYRNIVRKRDAEAGAEAELARARLGESLVKEGLPPELPHSLAVSVASKAHLAVEMIHLSEVFVDLFPHVVHGALAGSAVPLAIVGPPLAVIAGLLEIGEAHETGNREAERRAFVHGFASHLAYGRVRNPLGVDNVLGQKQLLGEKAAKHYLAALSADARPKFLARYRGPQLWAGEGMQKALDDLGYYKRKE